MASELYRMWTRLGLMVLLGSLGGAGGRVLASWLAAEPLALVAPFTLGSLGLLFGAAFGQRLER